MSTVSSPPAPGAGAAWVLIAEMDARRAREVSRVFRAKGLDTVVVRNGNEVGPMLRRATRPLLMVLNLGIPVIDGIEVLRQAFDAGTIVPVIALTDIPALRDAALRLGIAPLTVLPAAPPAHDLEAAAAALLKRDAARLSDAEPAAPIDRTTRDRAMQTLVDDVARDLLDQFDVSCGLAVVEVGGRLWSGIAMGRLHRPLARDASPLRWPLISEAIAARDLLVIPNLPAHPGFAGAEWPVVSSFGGIAVMPILTASQKALGAAAVISTVPLTLTADDLFRFRTIAAASAVEIERALSVVERAEQLRRVERELARTREAARAQIASLEELALKDPLTGLLNRRGGEEALMREAGRIARTGGSSAVVLFDVDNFKNVNDTHGHAAGDKVLRDVALILTQHQRAGDLAVRWGGEEFLVVLPGQTEDGARTYAERVRQTVEDREDQIHTTVCGGVAVLQPNEPYPQAIKRADEACYDAKNAGRNCIR